MTSRLTRGFGSAAVLGALLGGCFAAQPAPECQVAAGTPLYDTNNFATFFKKKSGTCAADVALTFDEVGFQRYQAPGTKDVRIAIRTANMGKALSGERFEVDRDASNDCSAYDEVGDCSMCVATGGASDNVCQAVDDPTPRVDPQDPDGKNANALVALDLSPDAKGVCHTKAEATASESFRAESVSLVDGGTASFPAFTERYVWKNVNIVNTTSYPGTLFTADVTYSLDGCTDEYSAEGFWPLVTCSDDLACSPEANVDAGYAYGSGLNPAFQPRCDTALGVCVLGEGLSVSSLAGL